MLIRSQDKGQLIPLEKFVFSVYKSNIVCDKDCITEQSEISERIIGRYSTEKKSNESFRYDSRCLWKYNRIYGYGWKRSVSLRTNCISNATRQRVLNITRGINSVVEDTPYMRIVDWVRFPHALLGTSA